MSKSVFKLKLLFTLFVAVSLFSCTRKEQPEPVVPANTGSNEQKKPDPKPEYQRPLEETILLSASEDKVEVNGIDEAAEGVTVLFAEPYTFADTEYETVTVGNDYVKKVNVSTTAVEIVFQDDVTARLEFQKEVSLDIDTELYFTDYMSEPVEVPFKVTKLGHGDISFNVTSAQKNETQEEFKPEVEYDEESRTGTIKFCLNNLPGTTDVAYIFVSDGQVSTMYTITAKTYHFDVTVEDITLGGEEGAMAPFSFKVDTDIPNYMLEYETEGDFFTFVDGVVTTTSENRTEALRNGQISIFESKRVFSPIVVKITQESLPAIPPRENCIVFNDMNFKNAMKALCDADHDGEVSFDEALSIKEVVATGAGIKDLKGLEYFKNAWKVDLQNNDIVDATVLKELPLLYWLDLKGNKNLKTFDVTGCTQYFEHCEFEITDELVYYTYRQQAGVTVYSDPNCKHSRHIPDNRETLDWTHHKNLRKVQTHTKCITQEEFPWIRTGEYYENENHTQEGSVPVIVFTGQGYLDVDFNDGTWERMMNKLISEFWRINTEFTQYKDYFDVYLLEYLVSDRNKYHCRMDAPAESEQVRLALNSILADYDEIAKYSYESLFGETTGTNSFNLSYHINPNLGELFTTPSKQYPQMIVVHLDNNPIYTSFIYNGCREWGAFGASSQVTSDLSYKGYVANMYYSTHGRMGTDESDEYWFSYNVIYGLTDIQNFSIEGIIEEAYNHTYSVIERIFKLTGFLSW